MKYRIDKMNGTPQPWVVVTANVASDWICGRFRTHEEAVEFIKEKEAEQ